MLREMHGTYLRVVFAKLKRVGCHRKKHWRHCQVDVRNLIFLVVSVSSDGSRFPPSQHPQASALLDWDDWEWSQHGIHLRSIQQEIPTWICSCFNYKSCSMLLKPFSRINCWRARPHKCHAWFRGKFEHTSNALSFGLLRGRSSQYPLEEEKHRPKLIGPGACLLKIPTHLGFPSPKQKQMVIPVLVWQLRSFT